jgi:hypothetical protein
MEADVVDGGKPAVSFAQVLNFNHGELFGCLGGEVVAGYPSRFSGAGFQASPAGE